MTIRLGLISWATGALVLAAVAACSDDTTNAPSATPTPSATSVAPSPTSSPSPTSPSDAASDAATSAMRSYFTVVSEVGQDPKSPLKRLETVATSTQLQALETLHRGQRDRGRRQTGSTVISEFTVQSVNLDNSDPGAGKVPTVVIDVCWDVSGVDVLDRNGTSVVSPDRPDTGWTRYSVANYDYADDPSGGWRVATGQDLKEEPCAAS
ncbi:hypothetical protein [Nocardioides jishulii]|uniref:Lipoprotein n=1 Tax=Nocardioides jishulii TaxID=2575440 RepID=A0A4U2YRB4_9ACTN|nr:hypothetical protein [Nocardioides jishulii]QCX27704.1 hypothetical protein FCL41_09335 [Nocardioides jishulii]TKI62511.1 hypothetical protein FC770_09000 [Nocardioides jishulii]